jgi:hypothetical protein
MNPHVITSEDYNAITTALGAICFSVTRRLAEGERREFLADLVSIAHARNTANDLRGETLLLDLAQDVAAACEIPPQSGDLPPNG